MSLWGLWCRYDGTEMHVVPCDDQGNVLGGHICASDCWCLPKPNPEVPNMFSHHDPERGASRDHSLDA